MILVEIGNLNGLVALIIGVMFGPPVLLSVIGVFLYKSNPKASKVLFILAAIYLLIGLGMCGTMFI
ncbi:hypothetical protein [Bernardetia sp. MNP-M8]|uniref:hypothetical protein n=1 Tax=Bernardetia sp. MNP-M8 TaxID=3127470 RepID=UPI0030CD7353